MVFQVWPSGGSSDSWNHMNQHPPINQNVASSVPMDIEDGTLHNGYINEDLLLFNEHGMGISETSPPDLGNFSGTLVNQHWSKTEQRSEEGKMFDGTSSFSEYNNLPELASGSQEILPFNAPSPSTKPLPSLPSGNSTPLQVKEEEIAEYNNLPELASGSQEILPFNAPSPSTEPLPSLPSGNLAPLQVKEEEEIPTAEAFSSEPSSEGQKEMTLTGTTKRGRGVRGGGNSAAATLEGSARFRGTRKRSANRQRRFHYNLTHYNLTMNMQMFNTAGIQALQPPPQCHLPSHRPQRRGYIQGHMNAQEEIKHEINKENLEFLFQKVLQNSDVGSLGRVVIPKRDAEAHLPPLDAREGIMISMIDMDTLRAWNFKYRFWPNNKSRMYILENTGQFVKSHGLVRGDYMMIYRDNTSGKYVIKAKKTSDDEETLVISCGKDELCSDSNAVNGGSGKGEPEARPSNNNEVSSKLPYECPVGASGHAYFSTAGDIFSVEFAVNFSGIPNSPQLESIPSFGSDDINDLDDFFP